MADCCCIRSVYIYGCAVANCNSTCGAIINNHAIAHRNGVCCSTAYNVIVPKGERVLRVHFVAYTNRNRIVAGRNRFFPYRYSVFASSLCKVLNSCLCRIIITL